jgi:hypothetical protein
MTIVGERDTHKSTYAIRVACQVWNKSHVRGHVKLVQATSSNYVTMIQNA